MITLYNPGKIEETTTSQIEYIKYFLTLDFSKIFKFFVCSLQIKLFNSKIALLTLNKDL